MTRHAVIRLCHCLAALAVILAGLPACAAPGATAPAQPQVQPTHPPAAVEAPTLAPQPQPQPSGLIFPTDEQIDQIRARIKDSQANPGDTGHVPPPPDLLDRVAVICKKLVEQGRLLNRDCAFNPARATTYTLPGQGALYQMLSLDPNSSDVPLADELLQKSNQWGQAGLAVGGLLLYQEKAFLEIDLPPGAYLVRLERQPADLVYGLFNEQGDLVAGGTVRLRRPDGPVKQPYTFVLRDEICYAQLSLQTCLWLSSRDAGDGQNAGQIKLAVSELENAGLLAPGAPVNIDSALASVDSRPQIKNCWAQLQENQPAQCLPDIVAAGAEAVQTNRADDPALQASTRVAALLTGIGVVAVMAPLDDYAFALQGPDMLDKGSYRVDLVLLTDDTWLAQYVRADKAIFYDLAVPVHGRGVWVDVDKLEPIVEPGGVSLVMLDRYLWRVCQSATMYITCRSGWYRDICFTNKKFGWCDQIGY